MKTPLAFAILLVLSLEARPVVVPREETKFRAKTYSPQGTLQTKSYEAKSFGAGKSVAVKTYSPQASTGWQSFQPNGGFAAKNFEGTREDSPSKKFEPSTSETHVKTFQAIPGEEPERKPFVSGMGEFEAKRHKDREATGEYNPMLAPRQGIKEEHLNEK